LEAKFKGLSFSTSWNWRLAKTGNELIDQIMALGFDTVELNYKVTQQMYSEIYDRVERKEVTISSVHNVFPFIEDKDYDTDSQLLGYKDKDKRQKALEYTKRTIHYAAMLGAKAVVIHPGEVPVEPERNYDRLLKNLYQEGKKEDREYKVLFDEMLEYRNRQNMSYISLIKDSLEELNNYIEQKNYNICLGIENRAMCCQIPDFKEANFLLEQLKGLPVYFWYDIGHGIMMENLGLFCNIEEAYKIKDKIIGVHIHDAQGVDDHFAPYTFEDNLDKFIDIIKEVPIKVLELGVKNKSEDIIRGTKMLYRKLGL
jgi:sugar phosphate isomerase/epimerase